MGDKDDKLPAPATNIPTPEGILKISHVTEDKKERIIKENGGEIEIKTRKIAPQEDHSTYPKRWYHAGIKQRD